MPTPQSSTTSNSDTKRLACLAAAFTEHRRISKPGGWTPRGLRAQVVAALDAGISVSAIQKACHVSWSQITRWRSAARRDSSSIAPPPKVLSVIDTSAVTATADASVELRIGSWCVRISQVTS